MAAGRYVVADPSTMLVVGGPYLWDGATEWIPPELEANPDSGYRLFAESEALGGGYSYPQSPSN